MIKFTNKSSSRYNLKTVHAPESDKFDSLFCNSKIAEKKRNFVDLVNQRPGSKRKYSNLKAFHSIPLLNNIKRYLSIDVVRETKNNKYQLIVKKNPERPLSEQKKMQSKSPFTTHQNPKLFEDKIQSKLWQPFHRTNSTAKDQLNWQEMKSFRDRLVKKDSYRQALTAFTNRKLSSGFENSRKKQIYTQETQRKTSHTHHSPTKIKKISPFLIEGNSMNVCNSPVWILNNDF